MNGELMVRLGAGLMVAAVVLAIAALVVFHIRGKRLREQLEAEFGKKRR